MDFLEELKKLADATEELIQAGSKTLDESANQVRNSAIELTTYGSDTLNQFQAASSEWMLQTAEAIEQTLDTVKCNALEITVSSMDKIEELKQHSDQLTQSHLAEVSAAIEGASTAAIGLGTAGLSIAESLKDLPKVAEALAQEMPKIAHRLRNRAGIRVGEAPRTDADVMKLFEKIPGTSKLGANETTIREFLADKHGSHIFPRSQEGSNGADNILWEIGSDNIQRGARVMTGGEQIYIRFYNAVDSILKNSGTIAQLGIAATGTAILTQVVITAATYVLDLYRGDITIEEFRDRIVAAAVTAGIATPIFFLILIAAIALFPELTLLLSAPIVVGGFNALFGIGIAVPIIQSLLRHLEAGGFGEEAAIEYQAFTNP